MNQEIISNLSKELSITPKQINSVLSLLEEGNTVPFIARYRKEVTGNLDEEEIRSIEKEYSYLQKLEERKQEVIRLIDEKGMLTEDLVKQINASNKLQEVEDIYLPFKEKRKTKATEAIANGLEPLANFILTFPKQEGSIEQEATKYVNDKVASVEEAIIQAGYIIAENLSETKDVRQHLRKLFYDEGIIVTKAKKDAETIDEKKKYEIYYDFKEPLKKLKSYRVLAINRSEKEKVISVKVEVDDEQVLAYLEKFLIKKDSDATNYLKEFIKDSYKRLLYPSLVREMRNIITEQASERAIELFSENLETLLMQPPVHDKTVLGVDPAYRTGCKLAVIDPTSKLLEIKVMYPTKPKEDIVGSEKILDQLLAKYPINQIVVGNGTASRETESFLRNYIKNNKLDMPLSIVSEAGASVYSASKLAQTEFPDLHVEERSAVSIARRIQDPMAELVKIDPKSIGVGQYQHDVNQKELGESLDFVMLKNINKVGVNINTASGELLKYVSGLDKTIANNIVSYREQNGSFKNRSEIKNVKRLGPKAYEQCAGFLKVLDGDQPLDSTFIHPESYDVAINFIKHYDLDLAELGTEAMISKLSEINIKEASQELKVSDQLITDLVDALASSQIDIRDELVAAEFDPSITSIDEVKPGMMIKGQVRNVVDFGAFVDIGIKNDGLIHISEISDQYIKDVTDVLKIGDIRDFRVKDVDIEKGRVQLSLKMLGAKK